MTRCLAIHSSFYAMLGSHNHELKYLLLFNIIVLFIVITTIVFFYVLFERVRKTLRAKKDAMLLLRLEQILPDIMFAEENEQRLLEIFKTFNYDHIRRSKQNSETLMAELLKLYRQFNGDVAQRLKNFYIFSDLIYRSTDKLSSRSWDVVSMGIHELSEMQISSSYDKIEKHIDSNNVYLRESAQLAILRIKGMPALEDLKQVTKIITPWQQMNIMQAAVNFDAMQAPDLSGWLHSANFSVTELAIKFIVQFQQAHCIEEGIHLLGHKHESVVNTYLWAIGETHAVTALAKAVKQYDALSEGNKIQLLNSIGNCGGQEHLAFLVFKLTTDNFRIRFAVLSAIQACAGSEMLQKLAGSSPEKQITDIALQLVKSKDV